MPAPPRSIDSPCFTSVCQFPRFSARFNFRRRTNANAPSSLLRFEVLSRAIIPHLAAAVTATGNENGAGRGGGTSCSDTLLNRIKSRWPCVRCAARRVASHSRRRRGKGRSDRRWSKKREEMKEIRRGGDVRYGWVGKTRNFLQPVWW